MQPCLLFLRLRGGGGMWGCGRLGGMYSSPGVGLCIKRKGAVGRGT